MAYPVYPNNQFYTQELQSMRDRIDSQLKQLQQSQMQQQMPQINQNFQITPTTNNNEIQAKYVTDINEVKNIFVINTGLFINKEIDTLWLKNVNGNIRTFTLTELIETDPKDREIEELKQELNNMKTLLKNNQIREDKEVVTKNNTKTAKK